jgi:hypothetical protein
MYSLYQKDMDINLIILLKKEYIYYKNKTYTINNIEQNNTNTMKN